MAAGAPRRLRAGRGHRSALHPLHLGHDRPAQGRGARQRRPRRGARTGRMGHVYGVEPGEVYWAASDVGWVVGHPTSSTRRCSHGCTTMLYEGKPVGTPDAGAFWRVIAEHRVDALFTAPTAFRAIKQRGPGGRAASRSYDLSRFRTLFLAGERCDPDTLDWARDAARGAGDRPLVADRDRLADRRQLRRHRACCRSSPARRPSRCRAATCACWTSDGQRDAAPGEIGAHRAASCRCRRAPAHAVERRRRAPRGLSRRAIPATTRPATPATWTRTATSTS